MCDWRSAIEEGADNGGVPNGIEEEVNGEGK